MEGVPDPNCPLCHGRGEVMPEYPNPCPLDCECYCDLEYTTRANGAVTDDTEQQRQ